MDGVKGLTNDDFRDPEEIASQKKLQLLENQAHEGALFADWRNLYCSKKLIQWLEAQIDGAHGAWLHGTNREESEAQRFQAQGIVKVKNWIYAQIKAGELAAEGVKELHDQGVTLEGHIKPPPTK